MFDRDKTRKLKTRTNFLLSSGDRERTPRVAAQHVLSADASSYLGGRQLMNVACTLSCILEKGTAYHTLGRRDDSHGMTTTMAMR